MVNDWISFDNDLVQDMLLEAVRPRTGEQYSQELVRLLVKAIPQFPEINAENFAKSYFDPLMKSLQDLLHLHDLLSADTSSFSNNHPRCRLHLLALRKILAIFSCGLSPWGVIEIPSCNGSVKMSWANTRRLHLLLSTFAMNLWSVDLRAMTDRISSTNLLRSGMMTFVKLKASHINVTKLYTSRNQHQAPSSYRPYDTKPRSSMAALDFRDTVHASFSDNSSQPYDLHDDDYVLPTDLTDIYETPSARGKHSELDQ